MDKTLSQEEVDALLQAIKSGQVTPDEEQPRPRSLADEVKVVSYNFRKPHLVSSDQLRGFQLIHESFAKSLQGSLLSNLKTPLEVKPIAIDNLSYGEFVLSLLTPTFITVLSTSPNTGEIVLEMNLSVVLAMIDILLGGDGADVPEPRELTVIEQSIAGSLLEYLLRELGAAWSTAADISFGVQSIESNPEFVQVASSESSVLSATFDLRIGDITGAMNICYPFEVIQPVLARVTARMSGRRERTANKPDKDDMLKAISIIPLEMRAEIGRSTILASQLGQLKIGDVVCLNRRVDSDIDVFIGERCCYRAELGARRGKVAVKLARPFVEAEEGRPVSPPANQAAKKPM